MRIGPEEILEAVKIYILSNRQMEPEKVDWRTGSPDGAIALEDECFSNLRLLVPVLPLPVITKVTPVEPVLTSTPVPNLPGPEKEKRVPPSRRPISELSPEEQEARRARSRGKYKAKKKTEAIVQAAVETTHRPGLEPELVSMVELVTGQPPRIQIPEVVAATGSNFQNQ